MLKSLTFERAKELLIIIPAAHVFLCFTYLFFYDTSFGYGVWLFSSPTDVFSISFSDVAPGYIFLFLGILLGHYVFSPVVEKTADGSIGYKIPAYLKFGFWTAVVGSALGIIITISDLGQDGFLFL